MKQQTDKFWLVWCPAWNILSGYPQVIEATSFDDAVQKAEKLARHNRLKPFFVMESTCISISDIAVTTKMMMKNVNG